MSNISYLHLKVTGNLLIFRMEQEELSMNDTITRIVKAYLNEKKGSNYVKPLLTDSESLPYYHDQEQTYTDLSQLDTTHSPSTHKK